MALELVALRLTLSVHPVVKASSPVWAHNHSLLAPVRQLLVIRTVNLLPDGKRVRQG
jgi:hypothetical protein